MEGEREREEIITYIQFNLQAMSMRSFLIALGASVIAVVGGIHNTKVLRHLYQPHSALSTPLLSLSPSSYSLSGHLVQHCQDSFQDYDLSRPSCSEGYRTCWTLQS